MPSNNASLKKRNVLILRNIKMCRMYFPIKPCNQGWILLLKKEILSLKANIYNYLTFPKPKEPSPFRPIGEVKVGSNYESKEN